MKILVISHSLKPSHIRKLRETAEGIGAELYLTDDEDNAADHYPDAEVVYGFGMKMARKSKNVKWLCVPSAGIDFVKPDSFANKDCLLSNSSGAYGVTIAEHIIAVSLMMMRKLTVSYEETLRGEWGSHKPQKSLKGCRITVLGTGDIGGNFARRAKAFEPAALIGVSRSGKSGEKCFDSVIKVTDLDTVLPRTDLLVMCLPGTEETEGILSRERLAMLCEGAYIVNIGRGSAIDEDALADRLEEGHLAGAALDVFRTEPLPKESRLWKTKNLLITPHLAGGLTLEYTLNKNVDMFCEDLLNYAQGRPLKYLVDPRKGY